MTKDKMIRYILSFDVHGERSSYGYAINMKIHNLSLKSGEKDKLYEIISDEALAAEFYQTLESEIENWRYNNKQLFGSFTKEKYCEGSGWINSTDTDYEKRINAILALNLTAESREKFQEALRNKENVYGAFEEYREQVRFSAGLEGRSAGWLRLYRWNGYNYFAESFRHDEEELKAMNKEDIRYIYKILRAFEKLSRQLVSIARAYASEEIIEEEYTITKTRKVFKNIL